MEIVEIGQWGVQGCREERKEPTGGKQVNGRDQGETQGGKHSLHSHLTTCYASRAYNWAGYLDGGDWEESLGRKMAERGPVNEQGMNMMMMERSGGSQDESARQERYRCV